MNCLRSSLRCFQWLLPVEPAAHLGLGTVGYPFGYPFQLFYIWKLPFLMESPLKITIKNKKLTEQFTPVFIGNHFMERGISKLVIMSLMSWNYIKHNQFVIQYQMIPIGYHYILPWSSIDLSSVTIVLIFHNGVIEWISYKFNTIFPPIIRFPLTIKILCSSVIHSFLSLYSPLIEIKIFNIDDSYLAKWKLVFECHY